MPYKKKQDRYDNQEKIRTQNKKNVLNLLRISECMDCGESNPIVLEFDHVKGEKKFSISKAVSGSTRSWSLIMKEINKCEVVCANCHRIRTTERGGYYRSSKSLL